MSDERVERITRQDVLGAHAVPSHLLGHAPEPRSPIERGNRELAHHDAFQRHYGVDLSLSSDAAEALLAQFQREHGL